MPSDINLTRRMVLEHVQHADDGIGGFTKEWQSLGALWADVKVRSGRDGNHAGGVQTVVQYRITVRSAPIGSSARVRAGQRLREGARVFLIDAVAEKDANGLYLECQAHEEVLQ